MPTTSSAVELSPVANAPKDEATLFATMLLDVALKPVSDAIGTVGSVVVNQVAEAVAQTAFTARSDPR